jgi:putative endonuclease
MKPGARRFTQKRQRAERRGRFAERLALWRLRLAGWQILARDWRSPVGEIDLVARRGRVLAVIEVKSRPDTASAAEALSRRQRRRIARAAEAFLAARPDLADLELRFDVILVAPLRPPRHWPAAWRTED